MPESKTDDKFHRIKYMAYCLSNLPPQSVETEYADFVAFAKFQLCQEKKVLMNDSVWDRYTDEEVLIEYYASLFEKSADFKTEFETRLSMVDPEIVNWMDREMKKTAAEMKEKKAEEPEKEEEGFEFEPPSLGE